MKSLYLALQSAVAGSLLLLAGAPAAHAQSDVNGWVVMSLRQERTISTVQLTLRPFDKSARKREVGFTLSLFASDQHEWSEKSTGVVRVLELPAGSYRIASFTLVESATNRKWLPRKELSIPFTVTGGEVTYLGEFLGTGVQGKPFLGFRAIEKPYFLVSDQRGRDLPLAEKEQPAIREHPVRSVAPMKPATQASSFRTTRVPDVE